MKDRERFPKAIVSLIVLSFLFLGGMGEGMSQPTAGEEKGPLIRMGEVTFRTRTVESTPSAQRMLEVHIQIHNRSQKVTAPAGSVKVALVVTEVKPPNLAFAKKVISSREEFAMDHPLAPGTGREVIFGFPIPQGQVESITFEVQVSPPEGEKRTVTWEGG